MEENYISDNWLQLQILASLLELLMEEKNSFMSTAGKLQERLLRDAELEGIDVDGAGHC